MNGRVGVLPELAVEVAEDDRDGVRVERVSRTGRPLQQPPIRFPGGGREVGHEGGNRELMLPKVAGPTDAPFVPATRLRG